MAKKLMRETGGMLGRWGGMIEHFKGDELSSVLTTSNRFLRFLDTPAIAGSTTSSSFDPAGLTRGKTTLYLVLPPEHARAQSPLLRLWIGGMFRAVLRGGLQETNKVHFVLDEAAALGHMQQLDDAVDKYRGYGVRLQFYYQSLGQLKKCWPSDQGQTLLANTTKVFFGTSELQTAQFISQSLGAATIIVDSGGTSRQRQTSTSGGARGGSTSTSYSQTSNSNWAQQRRELLQPDEVINLPPRTAITLTPGVRPIWTNLIRYYEEPELFRPVGWMNWITAACATLLASAVLLAIAIGMAAAVTNELCKAIHQQQQPSQASPAYQAPAPASGPPPYPMPSAENKRVP
jgi:type IV secretion system protein VirD4